MMRPDCEPRLSVASSIYWDQSRMTLHYAIDPIKLRGSAVASKLPERSVGRISFLIGAEQEIDRLTAYRQPVKIRSTGF
jgi:hypothetical protein